MLQKDEFLWVEKYRPKRVDDCILPESLKTTFKDFINQKNVPNLILAGASGVGKTTVAKAMLDELDCDILVVNGSLDRNIDTLRNEITHFASTVSFSSGRKYVILDEADYLNANSTQPALRNFMEEFSKNCGFILTCNFLNKIIPPLHSRCSVVHFKIPKTEKPKLAMEFCKRVYGILEENGIEYDKKAVIGLITAQFPDWRRILNELQRYSATGKIDAGILVNISQENIKELMSMLKNKDFKEMRKWVATNNDSEFSSLCRNIYTGAYDYFEKSSIPVLVLILAEYQYKNAFVADPEINTTAMLTEIMKECELV
tara:strand:+ start:24013 stop:24957 length:945 start_codon:yes stop_codon:yes gene_type:complete